MAGLFLHLTSPNVLAYFKPCGVCMYCMCTHCTCVQAVRKKGVEPEWEGPGVATRDKGLVYVLDNFDCAEFKRLLGKCRCVFVLVASGAQSCRKKLVEHTYVSCFNRIIGPAVVLAHVNKGWVS